MSLTVLGNLAVETKSPTEEAIDSFYELVKTNLSLLGGRDQTAEAMGVDPGDLTRALNRNGRYLTIDQIMRLAEKWRERDPETAQRLAVAFVAPLNLLVMTRTQMSAAEIKDRLLAYLRRLPHGAQLISDAFRSTDPCVQITAAEAVRLLKAKIDEYPRDIAEMMFREAIDTPVPAGTPSAGGHSAI